MKHLFIIRKSLFKLCSKVNYPHLISLPVLTLVLIFFCNCGGKNQIISREVIEKVFVTKKDAMLYNDSFERIVIDEIPAFIRVKTLEKILILDKSENERAYYKTTFNKKEGWVESKYLAETKVESNIKDKLADQLLVGNLKEGNVAFVDEENDSISLKIRDSVNTIH